MTTEPLSHIEHLSRRIAVKGTRPRAGDLTLNCCEMITSIDARDIFDENPDLDIIFVYFRAAGRLNLNVCFQRCALNCRPLATLTKADLTMD